MLQLKQQFIERYKKLTDFDEYGKYLNKFLRKAIRVNTLQTSVRRMKKDLDYWDCFNYYNYRIFGLSCFKRY